MAKHLLFTVTFNTKEYKSFWDDVAFKIEATENGLLLEDGYPVVITGNTGGVSTYNFCSGTTLAAFHNQTAHPYAKRVDEPDSTTCGFVACNLAVTLPVNTTTASDFITADGTATITVTGTVKTELFYSLNNSPEISDWQRSNIITGLLPGAYTVYVVDYSSFTGFGCRAQANFTITEGFNYGKRYDLPFFSSQKNPIAYEIQFFKKRYTGVVTPVCGSGEPVKLEYQDSGTDKYHILNGAKADINLVATGQSQFIDFFSSDEREYRTDIIKAGALFWRGFLLPEIYSEDFVDGNHYISVTAADGLGTLKAYPYTDRTNNPFSGERKLIDIIFDCLDKLDLQIPVLTIIDIYETGMREATATTDIDPIISDPLFQARTNVNAFQDAKGVWMDCETVLTHCLKSFGARIYQDLGKWVIESIDAKRKTCWAVTYNADRSFNKYELLNPVVTRALPNTGGLQYINGAPNRELIAAWKKTTVEADYDIIENIIPGGGFRDIDFGADGKLIGWQGDYIRQKEKSPANSILMSSAKEITAAKHMYSPRIDLKAGDKLFLKLEYKPTLGATASGPYIPLQIESTAHSLKDGAWVAYSATAFQEIKVAPTENSKNTYEVVTAAIPADGLYRVVLNDIIVAINSAVVYYSLSVQVLPGGLLPLTRVDSVITNKRNYSFTPEKKEIYFVDTQETTNYKQVHRNYLSINGNQSKNWHFKGETGNNKLINILASNVAYNYSRPTHILRGSLQGNIGYFNTIKEPYDENRLFMWNGLSIDFKRGEYSGTLIELITPLADELLYVDAGYVDVNYVL